MDHMLDSFPSWKWFNSVILIFFSSAKQISKYIW